MGLIFLIADCNSMSVYNEIGVVDWELVKKSRF